MGNSTLSLPYEFMLEIPKQPGIANTLTIIIFSAWEPLGTIWGTKGKATEPMCMLTQ